MTVLAWTCSVSGRAVVWNGEKDDLGISDFYCVFIVLLGPCGYLQVRKMAEIHDLKIVAEFSNEMLKQIRAVVREEVRKVAPRQLHWEEVDRLEARLKAKKCRRCGLIPVEALLSASALVGADLFVTHALCQCEPREPIDVSTDDSSPVVVVRKELSQEQRKSIVEDVKQSLSREMRLSSGRIGF